MSSTSDLPPGLREARHSKRGSGRNSCSLRGDGRIRGRRPKSQKADPGARSAPQMKRVPRDCSQTRQQPKQPATRTVSSHAPLVSGACGSDVRTVPSSPLIARSHDEHGTICPARDQAVPRKEARTFSNNMSSTCADPESRTAADMPRVVNIVVSMKDAHQPAAPSRPSPDRARSKPSWSMNVVGIRSNGVWRSCRCALRTPSTGK